jgi:hypothetical protein
MAVAGRGDHAVAGAGRSEAHESHATGADVTGVGMLSAGQRKLRARIAALALHSQGKSNLEPARAAFLERFLDEVDRERILPEAERSRRAALARRRYMAALALKSSKARSRRATQSLRKTSPEAEPS